MDTFHLHIYEETDNHYIYPRNVVNDDDGNNNLLFIFCNVYIHFAASDGPIKGIDTRLNVS